MGAEDMNTRQTIGAVYRTSDDLQILIDIVLANLSKMSDAQIDKIADQTTFEIWNREVEQGQKDGYYDEEK